MTLRTLTACQEAKFAWVFFEVDKTFSIVDTWKLKTKIAGAIKQQGCTVNVKSGRDIFEAEIIKLNGT